MNSTNSTTELVLTVPLLITYTAIMAMACGPVFIGSFMSVYKKSKDEQEVMSQHDAMMFPIVGSCFLFGLYLLFKSFSKEYINLLLTTYFLFLGFVSLSKTIAPVIEQIATGKQQSRRLGSFSIPKIPYVFEKSFVVKFGIYEIVSWVISAILCYLYATSKHWILNNILGLSFSIQGIAMLSLGSYKVGCILLGGLFFYDIFWVFWTDVMVTVAKSFDAPIKLLFPKDIFATGEYSFSMLGLGDIVIPGIFIALLLRYDAFRSTKGKSKIPTGKWAKSYFNAAFLGYVLGLGTTIFIMHTFRAAQPALLYLVPGCIGSSLYTALKLNDFTNLIKFSEEEDESDDNKKKE